MRVQQLGLPVPVNHVEGHSGHHTGLSDTTTLLFSEVGGLFDELEVPDQDGPDGSTHGLGQTDGDGVEDLPVLLQGDAGLRSSVPDSGTVTVQLEAVLHTPGFDADQLFQWVDDPVQRVFQRDQSGGGTVDVTVVRDIVRLDVVQGHVVAVGGDHGDDHGLRQDGEARGLVRVDVGPVVAQNGVWGLHQVGSDPDLIGQGTGDAEQTGFLAGEAGDGLLEPDGVNIFTVDGVPNGRL